MSPTDLFNWLTGTPWGALGVVVILLLTGYLVPRYVVTELKKRLTEMEDELKRYIRASRRVRGKQR